MTPRFSLAIFTFLILVQNIAWGKQDFKVQKVSSAITEKQVTGILYTLPQTHLSIRFYIRQSIFFAGPYSEYSQGLLSIPNVKKTDENMWFLDSVQILEIIDSDPQQIYVVAPDNDLVRKSISMYQENGTIFYPHNNLVFSPPIPESKPTDKFPLPYIDLGSNSMQMAKYDTSYRIVLKDSVFARVPQIKMKIENKTNAEKAKEIADLIFNLRQRKIDLLIEEDPKGLTEDLLKEYLYQINQIEEKYLSLFLGKYYQTMTTENLLYQIKSNESRKEVLFHFSPTLGIRAIASNDTKPVILTIENLGKTELIKSMYPTSPTNTTNNLICRIPDEAIVSLNLGNETIYRKKIIVYQFGVVIPCNP